MAQAELTPGGGLQLRKLVKGLASAMSEIELRFCALDATLVLTGMDQATTMHMSCVVSTFAAFECQEDVLVCVPANAFLASLRSACAKSTVVLRSDTDQLIVEVQSSSRAGGVSQRHALQQNLVVGMPLAPDAMPHFASYNLQVLLLASTALELGKTLSSSSTKPSDAVKIGCNDVGRTLEIHMNSSGMSSIFCVTIDASTPEMAIRCTEPPVLLRFSQRLLARVLGFSRVPGTTKVMMAMQEDQPLLASFRFADFGALNCYVAPMLPE